MSNKMKSEQVKTKSKWFFLLENVTILMRYIKHQQLI